PKKLLQILEGPKPPLVAAQPDSGKIGRKGERIIAQEPGEHGLHRPLAPSWRVAPAPHLARAVRHVVWIEPVVFLARGKGLIWAGGAELARERRQVPRHQELVAAIEFGTAHRRGIAPAQAARQP